MRPVAAVVSALAVAALGPAAASAQPAEEEGTGLPLAVAERPLTLTQGTVRGDATFAFARSTIRDIDPMTMTERVRTNTIFSASLGGAYGVLDDLELGAQVAPVRFAPDVTFGDLSLLGDPDAYGVYRFLRGVLELGGTLRVTVPLQADFRIEPGVLARVHGGEILRIDTGVLLPVVFRDAGAQLDPTVPLVARIQIVPAVFVGLSTGITVRDTDLERAILPAGAFAGVTVPAARGGPLLDVSIAFQFPRFLQPASDGDVLFTDFWALFLAARIHVDT